VPMRVRQDGLGVGVVFAGGAALAGGVTTSGDVVAGTVCADT